MWKPPNTSARPGSPRDTSETRKLSNSDLAGPFFPIRTRSYLHSRTRYFPLPRYLHLKLQASSFTYQAMRRYRWHAYRLSSNLSEYLSNQIFLSQTTRTRHLRTPSRYHSRRFIWNKILLMTAEKR